MVAENVKDKQYREQVLMHHKSSESFRTFPLKVQFYEEEATQ